MFFEILELGTLFVATGISFSVYYENMMAEDLQDFEKYDELFNQIMNNAEFF